MLTPLSPPTTGTARPLAAKITMAKPVATTAAQPTRRSPAKGEPAAQPVTLSVELSAAQVHEVVQAAAEGGHVSTVLSGVANMREAFSAAPEMLDNERLSGSLLTGLMLLASFPTDGSYMGIAELSRIAGVSQSTVHRYVSTLTAVGLLERDVRTRKYRVPR
jgi:DNA-binding transcriptional ArsR family regulator